jgi:hypothetical protein
MNHKEIQEAVEEVQTSALFNSLVKTQHQILAAELAKI